MSRAQRKGFGDQLLDFYRKWNAELQMVIDESRIMSVRVQALRNIQEMLGEKNDADPKAVIKLTREMNEAISA